jgi:hypothetical protein
MSQCCRSVAVGTHDLCSPPRRPRSSAAGRDRVQTADTRSAVRWGQRPARAARDARQVGGSRQGPPCPGPPAPRPGRPGRVRRLYRHGRVAVIAPCQPPRASPGTCWDSPRAPSQEGVSRGACGADNVERRVAPARRKGRVAGGTPRLSLRPARRQVALLSRPRLPARQIASRPDERVERVFDAQQGGDVLGEQTSGRAHGRAPGARAGPTPASDGAAPRRWSDSLDFFWLFLSQPPWPRWSVCAQTRIVHRLLIQGRVHVMACQIGCRRRY